MSPEGLQLHAPGRRPLTMPDPSATSVDNFARVSDVLYRGAQPEREGFAWLKHIGVKTIVSLRELHGDREGLAGLGMRYVRLGFNATEPSDELVAQFIQLVRDPSNQPVYVHCQMGADRTGMMVVAYRVIEQGWPMAEAVRELPRFGFHESWTDILRYLADMDSARIEALAQTQAPPVVEIVP